MHDLIIKGGTLIDGTGAASITSDVAIKDGCIVDIGKITSKANRAINADGLFVTPGWVDIHTHYDGQVSWDPYLSPSSWHGVTTAVMGNCGVGFAPAHVHQREWMMELMEGVEDIPGAVLAEGVKWEWETFPQYMDAMSRIPRIMNVGAQIPHGALRVFVMGERGANREAATLDDMKIMAAIAKEAIAAGALGFTSSRTIVHRTKRGAAVPSLGVDGQELIEIATAIGETGKGVLQLISDWDDLDAEFNMIRDVTQASGRPMSYTLLQHDFLPERWREVLRRTEIARGEGLDIKAQVACRGIGMIHGLECSMQPFFMTPSYQKIAHLSLAKRVRELQNPELKKRMLMESMNATDNRRLESITQHFHKYFPIYDRANYEPLAEESIAGIAAGIGLSAVEVAFDMMLQDEGRQKFYFPLYNYTENNLDVVHAMLTHPATLLGLGDAGAHCGYICDASYPTYLIKHWARDRTRGPKLPIEFLVHAQTQRNARALGMFDRGALVLGMKADINIIDYEKLDLSNPKMVNDLPAGGRRLIQKASGYVSTMVNGQVVMEHGEPTGQLPGQLIRSE
ncbi:MAG: N-acyl-D-amino-acid deacylase family protein [Burkholderiaceae bacterium]